MRIMDIEWMFDQVEGDYERIKHLLQDSAKRIHRGLILNGGFAAEEVPDSQL